MNTCIIKKNPDQYPLAGTQLSPYLKHKGKPFSRISKLRISALEHSGIYVKGKYYFCRNNI
ncbi:hypothetical protein M2459_003421 [Parabacteroides sp. PF5-5]|nr:hypothetical protein [Parabacteroides sp. PH5-39]MDH6317661.1 hypothetical protein [Parabacteroides sp. PF5-13]MDH6321487.1 hypothetical protein [Parabacteroides sp. PH5-13]MDH6325236.1 hypothetical protein [Parabacteroides sp. PH5-8]MDH6328846.1 hypothetical protein [Parabacteroides sp. PH5-41]MDH6336648.1 hypothetical protein [Parabacteroides sp. PF5-5]MDH6347712.1 hypothetical protein [Parabacteroides sp. PH5-46]MDH6362692.1 hypothetical protein [Parabacteroides sp. PH5-16]MDH6378360.